MYIVLIAMLALNVSSDVLDGFTQVEEGLGRTNTDMDRRNASVYSELKKLAADNPEKMGPWMAKADSVRRESKMLCGFIDSLKLAIVREADGESALLSEINNREDLDAASVVMLNPADGKGGALRERIDIFRENVSRIVVQPQRRSSIESALSTAPFRRKGDRKSVV